MVKTNKTWHDANRMPARATREQRIEWHILHTEVCGCRPAPELLRDDIAKRTAASTP